MKKFMVKKKYHIGNVPSSESGSTTKSVDQKTILNIFWTLSLKYHK